MYTNLIGNYISFKSLLEDDEITPTKNQVRKNKTLKPKFVRKIEEEIVDDYNIPNIEKRQVIVEEVTQKQLEVEKVNKELTEEIKRKEDEFNTLNSKINQLLRQLDKQNELSYQEIEKVRKESSELIEKEKEKSLTEKKEYELLIENYSTKIKKFEASCKVLQKSLDEKNKEILELKYIKSLYEQEKEKNLKFFEKYSTLKNKYGELLEKNERLTQNIYDLSKTESSTESEIVDNTIPEKNERRLEW